MMRLRKPGPRRGGQLALVTGASSGIGAATVAALTQRGYRVLAGVRNADDAARVAKVSDWVEPIILDITNADHRDALRERLSREPGGLSVLVNNAGVLSVGPIELIPDERWEAVLNVNVLGTIAITRIAIPSLLRAGGRLINVSSPVGKLALPMFGPYSVSKWALEAFNDTVRRELRDTDVQVICVTPGMIITPIFDKGIAEGQSVWDANEDRADLHARYGRLAASALEAGNAAKTDGQPPEAAAELIMRAVTARWPRTRYRHGFENHAANLLPRLLPDRVTDAILAQIAATDYELATPAERDLRDLPDWAAAAVD